MTGLITLVYVSSAVQAMTDEQLKILLEVSQENNARDHITGMLLYKNQLFIQAIEGEDVAIHRLYDKIRRDARHESVMCLHVAPIERRNFSNWTMGFNRLDTMDLSSIPGYTNYLAQPFEVNAFVEQPDRAGLLLAQFRERTTF